MDLQNRIIRYLETTKEATVFEIMNGADVYPYGGPSQVRSILAGMIKQGTIKRGSPNKYRIIKEIKDNQIKMF